MAGGKSKRFQFSRQPIRDTYAFVIDGEDEKWYLQLLKKHEATVRVDIKPELNLNKTIEEQYELVCELAESYTKVLWVIDLDVVIKQDAEWKSTSKKPKPSDILKTSILNIKKRREELEKEQAEYNIYPIVNTPGLEYWFLLHLEPTSRYYKTCKGVIDRLKKIKGSPLSDYKKAEAYYKKSNNDIYMKLKPYIATARANAKRLGEFEVSNMQKGLSEMYVIFDELGI